MAKMTAAERYAARQVRKASGLRARTLAAAYAGARHARLRAALGPDWQRILGLRLNRQNAEWHELAERNLVVEQWPGRGVV